VICAAPYVWPSVDRPYGLIIHLRLLKSEDNQPIQAAIGRSAKQGQSAGLINVKQVSNLD